VTGKRYHAVDIARTAALAGMVVFHFVYDLDLFGWVPRGTATQGWFWYHARLVAGSFIFLAGLSLWLAHGRGIRWSAFARRILHSILVSSVVGLLFLRLPAAVILAAAAAVFALPWQFTHPTFGGWLIWTGLAPERPLTADFEPFFPWFAPFLAGLASGRLLSWANLWPRLALRDTALVRRLAWPGRHSLAIYLIHQPVLIGLVAGATWAATHLR
jgi:uncharacterized membrane protein